MSGHSKWSKVKNQKGVTDVVKGKLYTFHSRRIAQAVHDGHGLDAAVSRAKAESVPREVIDRALHRAQNNLDNAVGVIFEGFAANGKVTIIIKAQTDNNTRTSNEIRRLFDIHGARLATPGAVMHLFQKLGHFYVFNAPNILDLILDSGAEDYHEEIDQIEIITSVSDLENVVRFFEEKQIEIQDKEIIFKSISPVEISENEVANLDKLLEAVSDLPEVNSIFTNTA